MLYFSIFFIIAGILLFAYSVFHKSIEGDGIRKRFTFFTRKKIPLEEGNASESAGSAKVPRHIFSDDIEYPDIITRDIQEKEKPPVDDKAGFVNRGGAPHDYSSIHDGEEIILFEPDIIEEKRKEEPAGSKDFSGPEYAAIELSGEKSSGKAPASENDDNFVLYDDRSSVINYSNNKGFIDPTLEEYRKIKRVGRGRFILDREGVNFHLGKKLFRFDFYKTREIVTGGNFIALFIKGSDTVKLFVVDKETDLLNMVKEKFTEYRNIGNNV